MTAFDDLTWQEAMRQGHGALLACRAIETARSSPTRTRERPQEVTA
jgi:hypothetical protein